MKKSINSRFVLFFICQMAFSMKPGSKYTIGDRPGQHVLDRLRSMGSDAMISRDSNGKESVTEKLLKILETQREISMGNYPLDSQYLKSNSSLGKTPVSIETKRLLNDGLSNKNLPEEGPLKEVEVLSQAYHTKSHSSTSPEAQLGQENKILSKISVDLSELTHKKNPTTAIISEDP